MAAPSDVDKMVEACIPALGNAFPTAYATVGKKNSTVEEGHSWPELIGGLQAAFAAINVARLCKKNPQTALPELVVNTLLKKEKLLQGREETQRTRVIAELNVIYAIVAKHLGVGEQFDISLANARQTAATKTPNAPARP